MLDGLQSRMKGQQLLLTSNSKTLSICHHLCSSTLCTAAQLLSSAAGSCSDSHSDSSNFKCKLFLFADFSFFPRALLLPPPPPYYTEGYSLGYEATNQLRSFTREKQADKR